MKPNFRLPLWVLSLLYPSAMQAAIYVDDIAYEVTSDNEVAVMGCKESITSLVIPTSVVLYDKTYDVTTIGKDAFQNNSTLKSITIPSSITQVDATAFSGCSSVKDLTYADGCVTTISTHLTSIQNVHIPNSVTSIGEGSFLGCEYLASVDLPNTVESIGIHAFWGCYSLTSITIPSSMIWIDTEAFKDCWNVKVLTYADGCTTTVRTNITSIEKVQIPNSVTTIADDAFWGCKSLCSVDIPSTVTEIGERAFRETGIASISIPNSITRIKGGAFQFTPLTSLVIPNHVTHIDAWAFSGCQNLSSVKIPQSVEEIGEFAFSDSPIKFLEIDNQKFCSTTWFGPQIEQVSIGSSVTNIGDEAFKECMLTTLSIPSNVTSIGTASFQFCSKLNSVTMPSSVTSIGEYAFDGCPIETLNVDNEKFCSAEFFGKNLKEIVIGNSVTSIGQGAFSYCSNLSSVTIPSSVKNIGQCAFYWCESLQSVNLPEGITKIELGAFSECRSLSSVDIPDGVTSIEEDAFYNCALTSIVIPENVTTICKRAFVGCKNLNDVVNLSNTPQTISREVFEVYSNLHVLPGFKQIYSNADIWDKFTIIDDALDYMNGTTGGDEPTEVVPSGKCLAVTCTESKPNAWDSQIFINFPTLLEKGKSYTFTMNVRGSNVLDPKQGQWGPEAIQLVLQDNNSSNRDEWGGPADLQYLAHFAVTTEWVYNITDLDGNTIVTDGKYPYSRLLLNLGNYAGTLYIDNVRAIDEKGTELFCITFETPEEQALVENGWMNLPKEFVDATNSISSVSADTTSSFIFNLYGQKANATDGFRIQNGKVILVK